jgi:hypothetical protein
VACSPQPAFSFCEIPGKAFDGYALAHDPGRFPIMHERFILLGIPDELSGISLFLFHAPNKCCALVFRIVGIKPSLYADHGVRKVILKGSGNPSAYTKAQRTPRKPGGSILMLVAVGKHTPSVHVTTLKLSTLEGSKMAQKQLTNQEYRCYRLSLCHFGLVRPSFTRS